MSTDIDVLKLELQPFVKRSFTTAAGNVGGTTLVDATLVEAANFWNGSWVLLRTGTYAGQLRRVTGFAAGTVTLDHTVGGQIIAGIQYAMMTRLPVDIIAGGGLKADLRQVLGQGADLSPANPLLNDPVNRWARQLGQVDLARVLGAALAANNPVIVGLYDAAGNRMPAMDVVARAGYQDVIDRAGRLLGIVYGNVGQLQQRAVTGDALVQLRTAGAEYDARQIRALVAADVVTVNNLLNPHPISLNVPTAVLNGQVTLTGTPVRDPLAGVATPIVSVTIENPSTNAVVYVGNATVVVANGYRLQPGVTVSLDIDDLNKVYVTGTAGNVVSYLAVN